MPAADLLALLEQGELRSDALPLAHEHPICHQRREAADRVCQQCSILSKDVEHGFFCCCGVRAPRFTTHSTPHNAQHAHPNAQPPPRARAGLRLLHVHRVCRERRVPRPHTQALLQTYHDEL